MARGFGTTSGVGTTDKGAASYKGGQGSKFTFAALIKRDGSGDGEVFSLGTPTEVVQFATVFGSFAQVVLSRAASGTGQSVGDTHFVSIGTGPDASYISIVASVDASTVGSLATVVWYIGGVLGSDIGGGGATGAVDQNSTGITVGNNPGGTVVFGGSIAEIAFWPGVVLGNIANIASQLSANPVSSPLFWSNLGLGSHLGLVDSGGIDSCGWGATTFTGTKLVTHPAVVGPSGPRAVPRAAAPSGSISGSAAWSFLGSATLLGAGAASSTAALTVAASGNLKGAGAAAGTSALQVSASGAAGGKGAASSTAALSLAAQGALAGAGVLAGSAATTVNAAGTLVSPAIVGTAALAMSASGSLAGTGALAATSSITWSATGALLGAGQLASTVSLAFGASGALLATGALSSVAALAFSASGALKGSGALASTASVTLGAAGTLLGAGQLAGAAATHWSLSAGSGALAGTSSIVLGAAGSLSATGQLTAVAAVAMAASGSLLGAGAASGTAALTMGETAVLGGAGALAGAAAWAWSPSGLLASGALRGLVTVTLSASGAIVALAAPLDPWPTLLSTIAAAPSLRSGVPSPLVGYAAVVPAAVWAVTVPRR